MTYSLYICSGRPKATQNEKKYPKTVAFRRNKKTKNVKTVAVRPLVWMLPSVFYFY